MNEPSITLGDIGALVALCLSIALIMVGLAAPKLGRRLERVGPRKTIHAATSCFSEGQRSGLEGIDSAELEGNSLHLGVVLECRLAVLAPLS
jgi:hypothetical protein